MVQINIKVKSGDLERKLRDNLQKHRDDYTSAMAGYWEEYEKRLKQAIAEVGLMKNDYGPDDGPKENPLQGLVKPRSYEDDYKIAISMMERIDDSTEIELDTDQYRQLWMDDWQWKGQFTATNSMYNR